MPTQWAKLSKTKPLVLLAMKRTSQKNVDHSNLGSGLLSKTSAKLTQQIGSTQIYADYPLIQGLDPRDCPVSRSMRKLSTSTLRQ